MGVPIETLAAMQSGGRRLGPIGRNLLNRPGPTTKQRDMMPIDMGRPRCDGSAQMSAACEWNWPACQIIKRLTVLGHKCCRRTQMPPRARSVRLESAERNVPCVISGAAARFSVRLETRAVPVDCERLPDQARVLQERGARTGALGSALRPRAYRTLQRRPGCDQLV